MEGPDQESEGLPFCLGSHVNGTNPSLPTLARPRSIEGKGDRQVQ